MYLLSMEHISKTYQLEKIDIGACTNGTQLRSWCYISDFISGLLISIFGENTKNQVFKGNPQAITTILGLAEKATAIHV